MTTQDIVKLDDIHQQCSLSNDFIIKSCLNRKCLDNITLVIVAFENFERIFSSPILHTCEDQPVSRKILGDTVYSTRTLKRPNLEKITKLRSESSKANSNNRAPLTSKGPRPRIVNNINNKLDDSSFTYNNQITTPNSNAKNNTIYDIHNINQRNLFNYKQLTPMNSSKDR